MPKNSNLITSHVIYMVKIDEEGNHKMKSLIFPDRNKDSSKNYLRKYSATAQHDAIRLLLSIAPCLPVSWVSRYKRCLYAYYTD